MITALNASDVDAVLAGVHDDVVFSAMNGDVSRGKEEVRAYIKKMLGGEAAIVKKLTVEMAADDLSILYGDSLVVAHGTSTDTYELLTGQTFVAKTRWTATLIKSEGGWKAISFQNGVSIFDDSVRDQFK